MCLLLAERVPQSLCQALLWLRRSDPFALGLAHSPRFAGSMKYAVALVALVACLGSAVSLQPARMHRDVVHACPASGVHAAVVPLLCAPENALGIHM